MKIYLQNPEKTEIQVFETENHIGPDFITWIKLTEQEMTDYLLQKAKDNKLANLNKFYNSSECWTYTVYTDVKQYASLTRDADFFAKVIPASLGKTMTILDDNNQPVQYFLDAVKGQNLNFTINNENGTKIRYKKVELENKIDITNNIDDINNINCEKELLNAVERKINLDSIK